MSSWPRAPPAHRLHDPGLPRGPFRPRRPRFPEATAMKLLTLDRLLEDQLRDLYSAENQLVKALPKMAKAATADGLRQAFTTHLDETRRQVERLNQVGEMLGIK